MCRILIAILFLSTQVAAQSSFGGYKNTTKWSQINTPVVRVIFPDSLERRAQRVANVIQYMNDRDVGLLGEKRGKVDIILRNNDVISNGYAQIAPLKSEFFMQAPQNTFEESAVDWTDQLAIHEYRHVNQFYNARRGIGWVPYVLFGDYGWGAMIGLSMPAWFIEGDATIIETALSSGGRGRVPSFSVEQRAQQQEGVNYSYMKALNGSFKDFVPNHYNTGYLILSEMRRQGNGNEAFDEITRRSSSLRGIIYPFRRAVKKVTGTSIKQHYFNASENLRKSIPDHEGNSTAITSLKRKNVVSYNNPILDDGEIFFSYGDRRDIRGIYKYSPDGEHKRLTYQGLALDTYFSKSGSLFAWEELQRDLRRGNVNFSNIILFNAENGKKQIIGRGEAYRSPSFSKDGESLIFVNGYQGTQSGIMMYNLATNARLEIIKSKVIQFLYPIAAEDGSSIFSVVKKGHKYGLARVGMDGTMSMLSEWDDIIFGPIKYSEGYIIFQGNIGVTDQVHAFDIAQGEFKQISDDPIGMYNPSNYENGLIVAERPHSQGFLLHEIKTSPKEWKTVSAERRNENLPIYIETKHLEPDNILDKVGSEEYEVSRYPRNAKMINTNSWVPIADGTEFGLTLNSDNILNNVSIVPSYTYNANVQGSFAGVDLLYGRWFPIFQLSYNYALPRTFEIEDGQRSFLASQHTVSPGVVIPLNLTSGTYARNIQFGTSLSQVWTRIAEIDSDERFDQEGSTFNALTILNFRRLRGVQNIFPRWGYRGVMRNRYRFNDGHTALNLANDFYLPGLLRNHGILLEVDYASKNESEDTRVEHVDVFDYAAGFSRISFDNVWSFNTNYTLPLLYPDWGFADFIYFKRIRTTVFHDYNSVMSQERRTRLQSTGLDLLFDLVFNNTVFSEISAGVRFAYMSGPLPEGKATPYHFDFVLDIPAF